MSGDVNVDERKPLLSEILRPRALSDLTLPTPTIHRLQRVIESGSKANMLFYGPRGSGKTSAARIFVNAIGGAMTINRSSETSPDLANCIKEFLSHAGANVCFVDEAHFISKRDQIFLVELIDWVPGDTCFLFAATDIAKLIPAIRSRLTEISFEVPREDREEVQKRLTDRYENMLSASGFKFDKQRLTEIIEAKFPDLRSIANNIEFEFA